MALGVRGVDVTVAVIVDPIATVLGEARRDRVGRVIAVLAARGGPVTVRVGIVGNAVAVLVHRVVADLCLGLHAADATAPRCARAGLNGGQTDASREPTRSGRTIGARGGAGIATAYHGTKGAVRLLTKTAAIEYAKHQIRVNSVHPGGVDTVMLDILNPEARQAAMQAHPLGRLATAQDVGYGVLYLASDESSFVTGTELIIDGGFTAQ